MSDDVIRQAVSDVRQAMRAVSRPSRSYNATYILGERDSLVVNRATLEAADADAEREPGSDLYGAALARICREWLAAQGPAGAKEKELQDALAWCQVYRKALFDIKDAVSKARNGYTLTDNTAALQVGLADIALRASRALQGN